MGVRSSLTPLPEGQGGPTSDVSTGPGPGPSRPASTWVPRGRDGWTFPTPKTNRGRGRTRNLDLRFQTSVPRTSTSTWILQSKTDEDRGMYSCPNLGVGVKPTDIWAVGLPHPEGGRGTSHVGVSAEGGHRSHYRRRRRQSPYSWKNPVCYH